MDPINSSTPKPTPKPTPTPTPTPSPAPVPVQDSTSLSTSMPRVVPGVTPNPTPGSFLPLTTEPVSTSDVGAGSMQNPVSGTSFTSEPTFTSTSTPSVAPIIGTNPAAMAAPSLNSDSNQAPVNPIFQPNSSGVAATDPIMMPEPAKAPDPIEEELKAPMKAAGPVPGSIGSAISGPGLMSGTGASSDQMARTPNVPFNDPAMQFNMSSSASGAVGLGKKKSSRTTLIILIVIAFLVVAALAVVLAMQLMGGNGSSGGSTSNSNSSNSSSSTDSGAKPQSNSSNSSSGGGSSQATDSISTTLSCVRNMTTAEVVSFKDAVSGTVSVSAEFSKNNLLSSISLVKSVVYSDEDSASNEPVEMEVHESEAKDITSSSAVIFDLPVDSSTGEVNLTLSAIQTNYGDLAFTCKVL